jgi:hypothetical protein
VLTRDVFVIVSIRYFTPPPLFPHCSSPSVSSSFHLCLLDVLDFSLFIYSSPSACSCSDSFHHCILRRLRLEGGGESLITNRDIIGDIIQRRRRKARNQYKKSEKTKAKGQRKSRRRAGEEKAAEE